MRSTAVSLVLLALAHSVAPAPMVLLGHGNELDHRQVRVPVDGVPVGFEPQRRGDELDHTSPEFTPNSDGILVSRQGPASDVLGTLFGLIQKIVQELSDLLASKTGKLPRALPSSSVAPDPASQSTQSSSAAARDAPPSSSTPEPSTSAPMARFRRQSPSPQPTPNSTSGSSGVGSQGTPGPSQSSVASTPGSVSSSSSQPSASATGQSTPGVVRPSASRV